MFQQPTETLYALWTEVVFKTTIAPQNIDPLSSSYKTGYEMI